MRLKTKLLAAGMTFALAVSVPTSARASDLTNKMTHLFSKKKAEDDSTTGSADTPKAKQKKKAKTEQVASAPRKHNTTGFPEPDKRGLQYQPQFEKDSWVDGIWKTTRNKDSWKAAENK
jgi:hypothetical protein